MNPTPKPPRTPVVWGEPEARSSSTGSGTAPTHPAMFTGCRAYSNADVVAVEAEALAVLQDYVERSTHWQEGGADRHTALTALQVLWRLRSVR
jgi:hypothetical protein